MMRRRLIVRSPLSWRAAYAGVWEQLRRKKFSELHRGRVGLLTERRSLPRPGMGTLPREISWLTANGLALSILRTSSSATPFTRTWVSLQLTWPCSKDGLVILGQP